MILGAGYGSISDFEIIFGLIAAFGFAFSIFNLTGVIGDYKFLRQHGIKNGRWQLAKVAIVTESGRAYLQLVFIYLAILSMTRPDPPPESSTKDMVLNSIARWGFLFAAAWVASKTIYTWYTRRRLLEDIPALKTVEEGTDDVIRPGRRKTDIKGEQ